jgi:predicted DCC family thiol-disulfide oxidoreductase YuxK
MTADHVLLYDADCGFCRWSLDKFLARDRDGRIRPVPLQSPEADTLLPGMDPKTKMASWHLVTPNGTVYSAGAALPPLLRLLPKGGTLAAVAGSMPPVTGIAYRLVAKNRTRLGKMLGAQACSVDPSARPSTKR